MKSNTHRILKTFLFIVCSSLITYIALLLAVNNGNLLFYIVGIVSIYVTLKAIFRLFKEIILNYAKRRNA